MPFLYVPRGLENETPPDRRFAIQPKNESAVEAYYSEFHRLQKIVSSNKCFPITSKSFYFADVNHRFSHFALK